MTKINSIPSVNEHEKLGANQGSTSEFFCNSKESYLVPLISKIGAMNDIKFAVLSIDPGLIYLY